MSTRIAFVLLLLAICSGRLNADAMPVTERVSSLPQAGFLLLDNNGKVLRAHNSGKPLIPASTLKLLTAWLALEHWGPDYRFETEFYLDKRHWLWIKGLGDPMLVSEELERIAMQLAKLSLHELRGIGVDNSFYAENINIDGQADSSNPYDAPVTALAANFNTVYLQRKQGRLVSAEAQTPLTSTARLLGGQVKQGKQRINLQDAGKAGQYLAEILRIKLLEAGVSVDPAYQEATLPRDATLFYRHQNSLNLAAVVTAMLRFSTNFIANVIFLDLGADHFGAPATMKKSVTLASETLARIFHWKNYKLEEGAGLSRQNRLSTVQLIELLQRFEPYRSLLPEIEPGVRAKTGTLKGVCALSGYIETDNGLQPFAIMINQPAPRNLRKRLLSEWLQAQQK